jgi:hypothetical protein
LYFPDSFEKEIAPSDVLKGQPTFDSSFPLIYQNILLSELAPFFSLLVFSSFV